jgi:hypothetical protein
LNVEYFFHETTEKRRTEYGERKKGKKEDEIRRKGKRKMPGSLNLSTVPEFLLITISDIKKQEI